MGVILEIFFPPFGVFLSYKPGWDKKFFIPREGVKPLLKSTRGKFPQIPRGFFNPV